MTRHAVVLAAALLLAGCSGSAAAVPFPAVPLPATGRWTLAFSDDFDGADVGAVWNTCHWWQVDGGCTIASNDEQQWYRPEAVAVADGSLVLSADAVAQITTDGAEVPFRSGMVTTGFRDNDDLTAGFAFTYGYVEARLRLPDGEGTWPAVWLLSADKESLPEIDLFESYGSRPDMMTAHVHRDVAGERASTRFEAELAPTPDGWHVVGVLWQPGRIEFALDGQLIGTVDEAQMVPDTPMYLIVNLALGGSAGDVDSSAMPQQLHVDYVRVWQQETS